MVAVRHPETPAIYTYSGERYELAMFDNGAFVGTPEDTFRISTVYLNA